jgi:hypothetical protein
MIKLYQNAQKMYDNKFLSLNPKVYLRKIYLIEPSLLPEQTISSSMANYMALTLSLCPSNFFSGILPILKKFLSKY